MQRFVVSIKTLSETTERPRPTLFLRAEEYEKARVDGASSMEDHCCLEIKEKVFAPSAPANAGLITFML